MNEKKDFWLSIIGLIIILVSVIDGISRCNHALQLKF